MINEDTLIDLTLEVAKYYFKKNNPILKEAKVSVDRVAAKHLSQKLMDVIKKHANVVSLAGMADAIPIPEAGAAVAIGAVIASTWKMYAGINECLGISISENKLKSMASGVVSNLAGNGVGYAAHSVANGVATSVPIFGNVVGAVGGCVANRASLYTSAATYLNIMCKIMSSGGTFDENSLSDLTSNNRHIWNDPYSEVINIGTIGHAGHGKSTLTAAITQVLACYGTCETVSVRDLDRAPNEIQQGVSIQTAHIGYAINDIQFHHIDCPGHANYVKNMIVGSSQMDAAILVVAATDGPMPQTREHLLLARQNGIKKIIVFLNKIEVIDDDDLLDLVEFEIRELLDTYDYDGTSTPIIRGSALQALKGNRTAIQSVENLIHEMSLLPLPQRCISKPFRLPVEKAIPIDNYTVQIMGTVNTGRITIGEKIDIVGLMNESITASVMSIQVDNHDSSYCQAGMYASLILNGDFKNKVKRGATAAAIDTVYPSSCFEASAYILKKEEGGRQTAFRNNYQPQFYIGTANITGTISLPDSRILANPGDNLTFKVKLSMPLAINQYERFSMRDNGKTIGAGIITKLL